MAGAVAAEQLKSFIERIELLDDEKAGLCADIRDVYAGAKGAGFDVKVMRQIVKLRKMEQSDREELEELTDLYMRALGMAGGTDFETAHRNNMKKLRALAAEDGAECTISVNGGPPMPLSTVHAALDVVNARKAARP